MASTNPLHTTRSSAHIPLILLSILFSLPFIWLVCTSLQPREQVGHVPPQWFPRQHSIQVNGETVLVTPPAEVGLVKAIVVPADGPDAGRRILVEAERLTDGKLEIQVQIADRLETRQVDATLAQAVPGDFVYVREWQLSKLGEGDPRFFCVPASEIETKVQPVWGNYPEAIRALTAGEAAKTQPLGELLSRSRLPWHGPEAKREITFLTYLANTLVVAILGVIGVVFASSLAAYGLSRIEWRGRKTLFAATLATMMIPFPVLMVPLYGVFRELGWIGTLMPLWVPAWFGSAFNIFLLRQFFLTIPRELTEAARIDGCSEFGIYWRIVLPLSKPALAVVALFHFLYSWNDFLAPTIFLTKPETFTMALGLQQYQGQHGGSEWHLLMAASVLLILPILALFFFMQKTFIQGIATTGMKG
ncbi:MAG: multiple sugar transport system permease protein [Rhodothermales bacterium]|jgi:multiple sugar transport system permease protein